MDFPSQRDPLVGSMLKGTNLDPPLSAADNLKTAAHTFLGAAQEISREGN